MAQTRSIEWHVRRGMRIGASPACRHDSCGCMRRPAGFRTRGHPNGALPRPVAQWLMPRPSPLTAARQCRTLTGFPGAQVALRAALHP